MEQVYVTDKDHMVQKNIFMLDHTLYHTASLDKFKRTKMIPLILTGHIGI